jgi:hypothetical protein
LTKGTDYQKNNQLNYHQPNQPESDNLITLPAKIKYYENPQFNQFKDNKIKFNQPIELHEKIQSHRNNQLNQFSKSKKSTQDSLFNLEKPKYHVKVC